MWARTSLLERVADWDSSICGYVVRIWIEWRGYLVSKNERRTFIVDSRRNLCKLLCTHHTKLVRIFVLPFTPLNARWSKIQSYTN